MLSTTDLAGTSTEKLALPEPAESVQPHSPFLLLPTELRSEIYTQVLSFLTCPSSEVHPLSEDPERVLEIVEEEYSGFRDKCISFTRSPPPSPYNTGVLSLLLTCRQVYHELTACIDRIYRGPAPGKCQAELELIVGINELIPTWTTIPPVPLSEWKSTVVKVIFKQRVRRWWGDGGPMPIGRHLLRLFGMFVQFGPSFRKSMPFGTLSESPPKLALDEMTFFVSEVLSEADEQRARSRRFAGYRGFSGYLGRISGSGLLHGKVKLLRVVMTDSGDETVFDVYGGSENAARSRAVQWRGYGWIPGYYLKD